MEKILEPINIAVVAPTGAGKTALISTVCDYIKTNSNKSKGYTLEIANSAAAELTDFRNNLSAQLAGKNLSFKSQLIQPTNVCSEYMFSINFEDKKAGISIKQPFKILDIPGAFVNNPMMFENGEQYKKFINHLDTSRILWIPIDAPVLMEANTSEKKSKSDLIRCTPNLKDFAVEWAQFAQDNGKLDFCNFVLVKCETYFSQDTQDKYKGCKMRFDEAYGAIVDAMKENNTEDKIACVAVETIGPVKVNKAKWADNSCEVEYTVEGVNQKIQGADCLLRDALYVAKENVTSEIDIEKTNKTNDKKVYSRKLDEIINEQTHKIYAMNNRKAQMSEQRRQLAEAERKLANADVWDKLFDFFGLGSLPEVREKIRNLNAHISSLEGEIAAEERKLNDLLNQKNSTERIIDDVDAKINALNNIQTWLNKLAGGNTDSKYYRSL
jgi:hypothetical protein